MEYVLPYALYCVAMSATPGPNNLMVLASGANFGYRRSLPHALGINIGFSLMVFIVALGLGSVLLAAPLLQLALKAVGVAYLLWLAWKIATSSGIGEGEVCGKPLTFLKAAAFQWVNVKAWFMVLGATSVYGPPGLGPLPTAAYLMLVMLIAGTPPTHAWVMFGVAIRRFLSSPLRLRMFNVSMAALLMLSILPML